MRSEVSKRLKECKNALEKLGEERESPEQQSKYLLEIVSKFQRITENSLTTNYGIQNVFDEEPDLRLATLVANRNAEFSDDFATRGHVYGFISHGHDDESESRPATSPAISSGSGLVGSEADNEEHNSIPSRKLKSCSDIQDILHDSAQIQGPHTRGILTWVENLYQESRGFEIGTFSASILSSVLKKQSAKWPLLAEGYICDIISMVHLFTSKALDISCGDPRVGRNILSLLMDDLIEKYRRSLLMTDFLLRIEREGTPMTLNHYLNSNLQKWSESNVRDFL